MTPAEADAFALKPAAYVHIPFCATLCPYCDFAVVVGQDDLADRYVDAIVAEIGMSEPWLPLESVYFGGGTPSRLDPRSLHRILDALASKHGIASGAEISLEANPEDFGFETARRLRRAGFNRVSFGVQSFEGEVLLSLGRRHNTNQTRRSVWAARVGGFDNISLDLIYGTPGETAGSWDETLGQAIDLGPDHVSCYALTVERGTSLSRNIAKGAPAPDPDDQADKYEAGGLALGESGLHRYEVSNWAKPGHECSYNLTVWGQGEYEAYGTGAHGYRNGRRFRNIRRLEAYLGRVEAGSFPRAGEDEVSGWDAEVDRLFVGLRRAVGVRLGAGTEAFTASDDGQRLIDAGVVATESARMRILRPLLTDSVHRAVIDLPPPIVSDQEHA